MKRKMIAALLLAGCCLLSGCSNTASGENLFSDPDPGVNEPAGQRSSPEEDAPASAAPSPSGDVEESAAPVSEPPQTEPPAGSSAPESEPPPEESAGGEPAASGEPFIDQVVMSENMSLAEELVPMSSSAVAVPTMFSPVASGVSVAAGGGAEIDYSNIQDGYIMARYAAANSKRLKVQVTGPTTTYTYDLSTGNWVTFPLSDGNGAYKATVLQNTTGKKYAVLAAASFQVTLTDEFAPFLRPNQYVNYEGASNTVAMAARLTQGQTDPLKKVGAVYSYVVGNLSYDRERAAAISSGQITSYLPNLDSVLASKKGICFDYAALMTGMLRSQGVPCKMVVGWAGTQYHAWVSVWTQETGWIEGVIFFDGTTWQRMDPTFASSANGDESIMQYIGDGSNYTVKYLY